MRDHFLARKCMVHDTLKFNDNRLYAGDIRGNKKCGTSGFNICRFDICQLTEPVKPVQIDVRWH